jgi:uncharacterized phage protein (TIGR01671 family)
MRDIFFRGKIKGLTDWIYGFYAKCGDQHFILLDNDNPDENFSYTDPNCVGQFTGLKDKKGVNIFEGDIVKRKVIAGDEYVFGAVQFMRSGFCVDYGGYYEYTMDEHEYDVVGNIHDNPELLEVE